MSGNFILAILSMMAAFATNGYPLLTASFAGLAVWQVYCAISQRRRSSPVVLHLGGLAWSMDDFCRGWLITGQTGSGKTAGAINTLLWQVSKNCPRWGGVCVDDKGVYWETLTEMFRHLGRADDLVLLQVRPEGAPAGWKPAHTFNFLETPYLPWSAKAKIVCDVAAAVGQRNEQSFFRTQAQVQIEFAFRVLEAVQLPVTLDNAYEFLTSDSKLPEHLRAYIKGQEHVIEPVCSMLRRGELGLANPSRPRGSFLFVGPTGVGKTEIANVFTACLFAKAKPLRFDMSEYQNQRSVEKLIGGQPDDTGLLGRALARPDRGTLLFDEVEKAHPLVLDLFLQILDDAAITLATGERKNLSGYYVVFTSNIGAAEAMRMQSAPFASIERTVLARVGQQLRPELVGRMTEKLVFNRLSYEVQREICEQMIARERARLHALGHAVEITGADIELILREGHHKTLGARPMRAAVERFLQSSIMNSLMRPRESADSFPPGSETN